MAKDHISLRKKLAAALRELKIEVDGKLVDAVPYGEAKKMTEDQVISLFHFDHGIHEGIDGPTEHWNLTPRFVAEHRRKTAEIDLPQIAKTKRVAKKHEEFRRKLLAKSSDEPDVEIVATRQKIRLRGRGFAKLPPGTKKDWKTGKLKKVGSP